MVKLRNNLLIVIFLSQPISKNMIKEYDKINSELYDSHLNPLIHLQMGFTTRDVHGLGQPKLESGTAHFGPTQTLNFSTQAGLGLFSWGLFNKLARLGLIGRHQRAKTRPNPTIKNNFVKREEGRNKTNECTTSH